MAQYVYSLHGSAKYAHIGHPHALACGFAVMSRYHIANAVPSDRAVCPRCLAATRVRDGNGIVRLRLTARDAAIIALLKEGLDQRAVGRRLRLATRTTVRYVSDAQRRSGAKTRFQWGYMVGLAEDRT